jgi:uroporphyrinogen-III synthase
MRNGGNQRAGSLAGVRVLVGRARHQARVLSAGLRKLGAEVIEIPFIEIRKPPSYQALDATLKRLHEYDWLIMTSVNGVDALWRRAKKFKLGKNRFRHLQIAAIGPATSKAIEKHGLRVSVVPKEYVAESVVESLRNQIQGKRVLLARARIARDVIPRELRELGARVDVVEAYQTVVPKSSRSRLQSRLKDPKGRPDVIPFTSSSMVKNFVALLGKNGPGENLNQGRLGRPRRPATSSFDGIRFVSIGPITSSTLRELNLRVDVEAKQYTIPGLIQAVAEAYLPPAAKPPSRLDRKL